MKVSSDGQVLRRLLSALPREERQPRERTALYRRIRALILLGGSLRPHTFARAIGRSLLDLPIDSDHNVMDWWREQACALASTLGLRSLPVRLVLDRSASEPRLDDGSCAASVCVERDPADFRGTGGLLHDLVAQYDNEDYVVVANAAQLLLQPLGDLVSIMAGTEADVGIVSHTDGTPSGLMLVRAGSLREIAPVGYIDLKEQALPKIALNHRVTVVRLDRPSGVPLRTLADYIRLLKLYHRLKRGQVELESPYAEEWQPDFSIVEDGAEVATDCKLQDSIVLRGAAVQSGALVVRSLVCARGSVRRGGVAVNEIVHAPG